MGPHSTAGPPSFATLLARLEANSLPSERQTHEIAAATPSATEATHSCLSPRFDDDFETIPDPALAAPSHGPCIEGARTTDAVCFVAPTPTSTTAEAHFGAMFEQFVTGVRVGKSGSQACVSLTLEIDQGAPLQILIEDTAMGPVIEVASDNPAAAHELEQALHQRRFGT